MENSKKKMLIGRVSRGSGLSRPLFYYLICKIYIIVEKQKYLRYKIRIMGGDEEFYYSDARVPFTWQNWNNRFEAPVAPVVPLFNERRRIVAINLNHVSTMEEPEEGYLWSDKYRNFYVEES